MSNTAKKLDLYEDYKLLRAYLMQRKGWTTSACITAETGIPGITIRQVCNTYPCLAVGSTEGYKLVTYASKQEIQHAVSTLMNRSLRMLERAQALSGTLL